jgi:hypothetical protein
VVYRPPKSYIYSNDHSSCDISPWLAMAVSSALERPRYLKDSPPDHKMKHAELARPATPEKMGRSSFSSVRENDDGIAQNFTSSKVSSYAQGFEEAVDDSSSVDMADTEFIPPLTQPFSKLHGTWYPANSFKGWKQIHVRGKAKTRSFGDLQILHSMWNSPALPARGNDKYAPGSAPIERLPMELIGKLGLVSRIIDRISNSPIVTGSMIELLVVDIPPNGVSARNVDLMALLLTSRTLHTATLYTLYKHITIPHSRIYKKFLTNITTHPSLGTIVRRLDFSHFNPGTIFSTASERNQTQNLTAQTLLHCFELTPYLQEFLGQEHIEDDLGPDVLRKLFMGLPRLQALDFCGSSSRKFRDAFSSILLSRWPESLSITKLSLHKCMTLSSAVFETILPRLANLTHLDVAGTKVTDAALESIPRRVRITHLNLAKCKLLSAQAVIRFLSSHPAVTSSLVFLSVAADARSHQLLDAEDVTALLPALPRTLKSLSIKGSKMSPSHIELLIPLTKHLEELAVGRCLPAADLCRLFVPDEYAAPHTLRYLDLSDLTIDEMDLAGLFGGSSLLKAASAPLEVIEITDDAFARMTKAAQTLRRAGWTIKEFGSRSWMVRLKPARRPGDDGQRWWKMGAESWGMRKIPVARAEVGGMYGSFMFGRRL